MNIYCKVLKPAIVLKTFNSKDFKLLIIDI